jgi:hypothetical protein
MVEFEGAQAAVVPAERTTSAGLGYQQLLDLPPAPCDGVGPAFEAAVVAAPFEEEIGIAVVTAPHRRDQRYRSLRGLRFADTPSAPVLRLKPGTASASIEQWPC